MTDRDRWTRSLDRPIRPASDSSIFSGDASVPLWDAVNAIPRRKMRWAVYMLGCKCQELESALGKLGEKVEEMERKLGM
jgi:hypothetical protein